jgi:hypothetical protein
MQALRELCGCAPTTTRIGSVQQILGKDVVRYGVAVARMITPGAEETMTLLYGCFAARKLLEAGCVSVLCRMDPARLLILREFQIRGRYALDERHAASIDWKADVVSEKKPGWTEGTSPEKFVRSLLGGHLGEVTWVPAIQNLTLLSNQIPDLSRSKWIHELVSQYEARLSAKRGAVGVVPTEQEPVGGSGGSAELGVLASFRTAAQNSFSTLSKGVHLEFVVDQDAVFDVVTIRQSMLQAVKVLTQIAFASHLTDSAFTSLSLERAFSLVTEIEAEVERDV